METITLDIVYYTLKSAKRLGSDKDNPEGTRYIQLSETLTNKITNTLKQVINLAANEQVR